MINYKPLSRANL